MAGLSICRYSDEKKNAWDLCVRDSRNGTFIITRDYIEYHKERFPDASYMLERNGEVIAVIPGVIQGESYVSHGGLTYGGWIETNDVHAVDIIDAFGMLNSELKGRGIKKVIYKPVPSIYHSAPAEEDRYALFRMNATLRERKIASSIYQANKIPFSHSRKDGIRKAKKSGVRSQPSVDFDSFWDILSENLEANYSVKPVHEKKEIVMLARRFPRNIVLHCASVGGGKILAGALLYIDRQVAHVQYISANDEGKAIGALDSLFDELINTTYATIPVFDFGTSCEDGGRVLNEGLIYQKEGFGGRGVSYDTYEYSIDEGSHDSA
jgi:hypothetical protein